jgi:hypothetical protein
MIDSSASWSSTPVARSARGACSLSFLLALSAVAGAQVPRVVVSTTSDVPALVGLPFPASDTDLLSAGGSGEVRPHFMEGHFLAATGFAPSDIDAFARRPGSSPGRADSYVFSLLSNEGGFEDGDILNLSANGGVTVYVLEEDLASAMGVPGANIDVDAVTFDDQGRILFSLSSDLNVAPIFALDGDVLRLETGLAGVTKIYSESDVQARVDQAVGPTSAILDVQALDWVGGDLHVAVQSPSAIDGAVIRITGTPGVVIDEVAMGLGGEEIDALATMRAGDETACLQMSVSEGLPGDGLHVEVFGAPGETYAVLPSGNFGTVNFLRFPGFGTWFLDPFDPWFLALHQVGGIPRITLDGSGRFGHDWNLPPGAEFGMGLGGEPGWSLQMVRLSNLELSAPFRVRHL